MSQDRNTELVEISKALETLGKYTADFNSKQTIATLVDRFTITPDLKKNVIAFHTNLNEAIGKNFQNLLNSDATIPEGFKNIILKEKESEKKAIEQNLNNNPILKNTNLPTNILNLFDNSQTLKVKYKYFEYKYVYLNLFLLGFIEKTMETLHGFSTITQSYIKNKDAVQQETITSLITLLNQILNNANITLNDDDELTIKKMMDEIKIQTEKNLADLQMKEKETVDKIKTELAKATPASTTSPTALGGKRGGFVRGSSTFPQTFYEL